MHICIGLVDVVHWPEILDNRQVFFNADFKSDGLFFDMSEKITKVWIKKFFCSLRNWISLESEIKMIFKFFFFIADFSKF